MAMKASVSLARLALLLAAVATVAVAVGGGVGGSGGARKRPEVRLRQGRARGEWLRTARYGTQYASYKGIPYALAPIGPLRFKDPRPGARWTGVLEATRFGAECPQVSGDVVKGHEDCLFLNVYVPPVAAKPSNASPAAAAVLGGLPVLVYFPGGAFVRGSSNRYGPDFFIEAGGAILVTINYRLGVLGFLHLGNSDVPGNAALKDQNMALRWVRENIAVFGGDPTRVTIFGQSAGGASVHAHVLSPMSAGLFQAAVSISGSLLAPWGLPRDPELQRRRLVARVGCGPEEGASVVERLAAERPEAIAACMRSIPFEELVRSAGAVDLMREMLRDQQIPFTPVVDGGVNGANSFIPDRPERLIATGRFNHVPYLVGVTSNEIIFFMASAPVNTPSYLESGLHNITGAFKRRLSAVLPDDLPLNATDLASDVYRPRSHSGQDLLATLVDASNDFFFVWPAVVSARLHSRFEPRQYLYYFDLDAKLDERKPGLLPFLKALPGVPHGGDIFYLFRVPEGKTMLPENSVEMRTLRAYVQLVLNVAITGKPTPQPVGNVSWPPFEGDPSGAYLNFGSDFLSIKSGLRSKQLMVWDMLYLLVTRKN